MKGLCLLVMSLCLLWSRQAASDSCTQVTNGNSYTAGNCLDQASSTSSADTFFGTCQQVANSAGKTLMIPSHSSVEWGKFIANPPPSVTLTACASNWTKSWSTPCGCASTSGKIRQVVLTWTTLTDCNVTNGTVSGTKVGKQLTINFSGCAGDTASVTCTGYDGSNAPNEVETYQGPGGPINC